MANLTFKKISQIDYGVTCNYTEHTLGTLSLSLSNNEWFFEPTDRFKMCIKYDVMLEITEKLSYLNEKIKDNTLRFIKKENEERYFVYCNQEVKAIGELTKSNDTWIFLTPVTLTYITSNFLKQISKKLDELNK